MRSHERLNRRSASVSGESRQVTESDDDRADGLARWALSIASRHYLSLTTVRLGEVLLGAGHGAMRYLPPIYPLTLCHQPRRRPHRTAAG